MAATFTTPPVKKPGVGSKPKRGKIKAQIFGGIAESVASAASRAFDFLSFIKKDNNNSASASTPATPPGSPTLMVDRGGEDARAIVDFIILEKEP